MRKRTASTPLAHGDAVEGARREPSPPVKRVNRAAVLSDKAFTDLNADPSLRDGALRFIDDRTILFTDDNGRQLDGTNSLPTAMRFITSSPRATSLGMTALSHRPRSRRPARSSLPTRPPA